MDKKIIGFLFIVLVVIGLIFAFRGKSEQTMNPLPTDMVANVITEETTLSAEIETETVARIKEFVVEGNNFAFLPKTMTVKKGDMVRITFKNTGGFHDLVIDEFNVATKQIGDGVEETVEFVADKAGSFEYYCSVGKHRAMGMKGTLLVTE